MNSDNTLQVLTVYFVQTVTLLPEPYKITTQEMYFLSIYTQEVLLFPMELSQTLEPQRVTGLEHFLVLIFIHLV